MMPPVSTIVKFADVRQGMKARVTKAPCATPEAKRLQEMGLTEGAEFEVLKVAPLGDPVEILLRGYRLCLRRSESAGIEVQLVGP